jgi:hypothetical protein
MPVATNPDYQSLTAEQAVRKAVRELNGNTILHEVGDYLRSIGKPVGANYLGVVLAKIRREHQKSEKRVVSDTDPRKNPVPKAESLPGPYPGEAVSESSRAENVKLGVAVVLKVQEYAKDHGDMEQVRSRIEITRSVLSLAEVCGGLDTLEHVVHSLIGVKPAPLD